MEQRGLESMVRRATLTDDDAAKLLRESRRTKVESHEILISPVYKGFGKFLDVMLSTSKLAEECLTALAVALMEQRGFEPTVLMETLTDDDVAKLLNESDHVKVSCGRAFS
mmetsp:Transcript_86311/g.277054  ORF Transcript_86311/g.277054 Transcript_86311/m.277054 type:complete len:111 (+) Transcript_86311:173-505(+)